MARIKPTETSPKKASSPSSKKDLLKTGAKPGKPPDYLSDIGKKCWESVIRDLDAMGMLDRADEKSIEAFSAAYEEYRQAKKELDEYREEEGALTYKTFTQSGELKHVKHPLVEIVNSTWVRMRSLLPDLYLTPLSRVRSSPKGGKEGVADPFDEFIGGKN